MDQNADDIKDVILQAIETSLDAQLKAVKKLRTRDRPEKPAKRKRMSQLNMAYNILQDAGKPLHINDIIRRIEIRFNAKVDRESIVSALAKKVARNDRFRRTDKNTFDILL